MLKRAYPDVKTPVYTQKMLMQAGPQELLCR